MEKISKTRIYYCDIENWRGNVFLRKDKYLIGGRTRLEFYDVKDSRKLVFIATTNMPEFDIPEDCTAIKSYSENEGVLKFLQDNKIVGEVLYFIKSGYVRIPVVKVLI
jgi:hypothetical protein